MTNSKRTRLSKMSVKTATKVTAVTLPDSIVDAVQRFIKFYPAKRFSTNLRSMLMEFLMIEGNSEANYLRHLLNDMHGLFELLDAIQSEQGSKLDLDLLE